MQDEKNGGRGLEDGGTEECLFLRASTTRHKPDRSGPVGTQGVQIFWFLLVCKELHIQKTVEPGSDVMCLKNADIWDVFRVSVAVF